jgi:hypothetical protein
VNERSGAVPKHPSPRPFRAVLRQRAGKAAAPAGEAEACAEGTRPIAPEAAPREPLSREPIRIEHRPSARPAEPAPAVARLLLGHGARTNEARLELRGGVWSGSAIHLVSQTGGVEVRLGASTESARVALGRLLDQVGLRLRSRGIVMRAGRDLASDSKAGGRGGARRGT